MSLLGLLIVLGAIGLLWWVITSLIPMPTGIRNVVTVVCVVVAVVYALAAFGIHFPNPAVPQMR